MIRAIISDLGGVIVRVDKSKMARKLAEYSGLTPKEILGKFSSTTLTEFDKELCLGMITPEEFFEKCANEFSLKGLSFEGFKEIYANIFELIPATVELLEEQALSRKIILLSNTDAIHYDFYSQKFKEVFNIFAAQALSFRLHIAKPDRKIYLEAAKMAGLPPEDCLYIDDIKDYVNAAKEAGMKAVQFKSAEQLKEELARLE
ncbi:MAG: HAD family phosphatase [Candidatus Woesearchaeota archaeon]